MTLDDYYRILDLQPGASAEEIKRAHRDLTKVWHPDRFGHDAALRQKAEQKLKEINAAYERLLASPQGRAAPPPPRRRDPTWAILFALAGLFFLLRRPTPLGLLIALVLFALAALMAKSLLAKVRKGADS